MKTMKKLLAWLLCVTLMLGMLGGLNLSVAAVVTVWDGSIADSFESGRGRENDPYIIKTAEQLALLSDKVSSGTRYYDTYFRLDSDIILNDTTNWEVWGLYSDSGDLIAPVNMWTPIGNSEREFCGIFDGNGHTIYGMYTVGFRDSGLFGCIYCAEIKNVTVADSYVCGSFCSGGIVGEMGYSAESSSIIGCINAGNVVSEALAENDLYTFTGGVVGQSSGERNSISDCSNSGNVKGNNYVGGIVGKSVVITDCTNEGEVTGSNYVGGIAGSPSEINSCYNMGTVIGSEQTGGICGSGYIIQSCRNDGKVNGNSDTGGIAGVAYYNIVNCSYNTGEVSGRTNTGGIAGRLSSSDAENCYNTGIVTGTNYVGGISGYNESSCVLSNSYNIGEVTGVLNVGGMAGYLASGSSSVNGCYYSDECITNGNAYGTVAPLSQMQMKETYAGWDFSRIWEFGFKDDYPYPTLRYFGSKGYTYTFRFYDNEELISEEPAESAEPFILPELDDKDNMTFAYWLAGKDRYYADDTITPTEDMEFQAVWSLHNTSEDAWDGSVDTQWIGSGVEWDPYLISSAAELAGLAQMCNSGSLNSRYTYFKQTNDIVLNDNGKLFDTYLTGEQEWAPIDDGEYFYFYGGYDGDGHTISGMYVRSEQNSGLFGKSAGTIKNLNITNSFVCGYGDTGGIVGYSSGQVMDCSFDGKVIGYGNYTGGVAGRIQNDYSGYEISNCHNLGIVDGRGLSSSDEDSNKYYTGGVVGYLAFRDSPITIRNCTNKGSVTGSGRYVGGVVGDYYASRDLVEGQISDCYNIGEVFGTQTKEYSICGVGGVVGYANYCFIHDCYNSGFVDGYSHVGGVFGSDYFNGFGKCRVENCYNEGTITANLSGGGVVGNASSVSSCYNVGVVTGTGEENNVGGVVYNVSTISDCYNTGKVTGNNVGGVFGSSYNSVSYCYNIGEVTGNQRTGGVGASANNSIQYCYNIGIVTGDARTGGICGSAYSNLNSCYNAGDISGNVYVGGLVGDGSSVTDCYNTGKIKGGRYTGGIAGQGKVVSCYNIGQVSGNNSEDTGAINGSHSYPAVTDSYYLSGCVTDGNDRGTMLTADQMKIQSSFENWNFNKNWELGYDKEYPYPTLRCFGSKEYLYELRFYDGEKLLKREFVNDGNSYMFTGLNEKDDLEFGYWLSSGARFAASETITPTGDMKLYAIWTTKNVTNNVWDGSVDIEWEGDGTEESPYLISSGAELAGIAQQVENRSIPEGAYFKQTNDIVLNDSGERFSEYVAGKNLWAVIGDQYIFNGHYDGDNYSISGLYVVDDYDYSGLFGSIQNAEIKNLNVNKSYVSGSPEAYRIGGIVGLAWHDSTIDNCSYSGTVTDQQGTTHVGGIAGRIGNNCVISHSINAGTIIGKDSEYVGGIVGYSYGGSSVISCKNIGNIIGNGYYSGGIVGIAENCSIDKCINSGSVIAKSSSAGIAAKAESSTIKNCSNIGEVNGAYNVGGIIGTVEKETDISKCYNAGEIIGNTTVGGIAGKVEALNPLSDCYNAGIITGDSRIGGIVGESNQATVQYCYSVGKAIGNSKTGGIVGEVVNNGHPFNWMKNNYYAEEVGYSNLYGNAVSIESLKNVDTYIGFDFENTWEIGVVDEYDYPTLQQVEHIVIHMYTVTFMDGDGTTVLKQQTIQEGENAEPPYVAPYSDGTYFYSLDHWDGSYNDVETDMMVKAVYKRVAIIKFNDLSIPFTVENGFSKDNLRVQLESYLSRVLCTTTNDFKMMGEIVWSEDDLAAYDPQTAGEYLIHGILKITDPEYSAQSDYYDMADGAEVKAVITVQPTDEAPQEFVQDDLTYTVIDGQHAMITGYTGNAAEIMLPSKLGGYTVTQIAEGAFAQNEALTSVTIPSSVVSVGKDAFADCISLLMVTLEEGVEIIGDGAFRNTSLICVTLPRSVELIGKQAFGFYGENEMIQGFAVYCYQDTVGVQYAKENSFECFTVNGQTDEESGISAVVEDDLTLVVSPVADGAYYETAQQIVQENDDVSLFNIKTVDSQAQEVQPGNILTVSIPVPTGFDAALCKVYRVNSDGSVMNMNARVVGEKLVFNTAHLSYYAVVEDVVAPPVAEKVTPLTVLLETKDGYEYRISDGSWQSDPMFDGLEPDTEYTFQSRISAKDGIPASAESAEVIIKTTEPEYHKLSGYINKNSGRLGEVIFELTREGKEPIILSSWSKVYSFDSLESGHYFMRITSELGEEAIAIVDIDDKDVTIDIQIERIPGSENMFVLGDVSGDGSVMITDATFVQRYIVGIETPFTKRQLMHADIDRSGELEIMDVTAIQYYLASMKTGYEIGWLV